MNAMAKNKYMKDEKAKMPIIIKSSKGKSFGNAFTYKLGLICFPKFPSCLSYFYENIAPIFSIPLNGKNGYIYFLVSLN